MKILGSEVSDTLIPWIFMHVLAPISKSILLALFLFTWTVFAQTTSGAKRWVGTWSTAPQLVEPGNMPPQPGLTNNTLRQLIRVSIGGDTVRLKLSNDFSTSSVTIQSVKIAVSTGSGSINTSTIKELKFNGSSQVVMNARSSVYSDPIAFTLTPRMDVAISIYFGQTSSTVTGHPGSRTTSYILTGNQSSTGSANGAVSTDHWYVINTLEVRAPLPAAAVAILGNSITDGRGSTTNQQNRWPDILSQRLVNNASTNQVGVLNQGIGGNCVLSECLGPAANQRYQRDILDQNGLRWVIIFHGINDIGGVKSAASASTVSTNLIQAYKTMISSAKARNLKVYGATIMPFKGNTNYDNQYSQQCRTLVNAWIRNSGEYDAVIDFDRIMRNPQDTLSLIASFENDRLHPTAAGYQTMGESVDLSLFIDTTLIPVIKAPERTMGNVQFSTDAHGLMLNVVQKSQISIKLLTLQGQVVYKLAEQEFLAGTHRLDLNAYKLQKGPYIAVMQAGSYSASRLIFK